MRADVAKGVARTGMETVGDLLDRWLKHCDSIGRSPTTMRKYRSITETVVRPKIGHLRLTKLTAGHLDKLYAELTAKENKATTVRRVHSLIGAALHQAERWDLVDRNVARRASPPRVDAERIVAPSPDEVMRMLLEAEKVEPMMSVLFLLAALLGARRGELVATRWSDIDWRGGTITIARSVYETAGGGWGEKSTKTHQVRTIGLDERALQALRLHRTSVDAQAEELGLEVLEDGFMFSRSPVGAEPVRPDVVTKTFAALCRRLEKPALDELRKRRPTATRDDLRAADRWDYHLHGLRHFSVTQGIAAGFDVVTVAGRHGHRDPSITLRIYGHVLEQRDRELAAALGRTLALPSSTAS
jgi:integrase